MPRAPSPGASPRRRGTVAGPPRRSRRPRGSDGSLTEIGQARAQQVEVTAATPPRRAALRRRACGRCASGVRLHGVHGDEHLARDLIGHHRGEEGEARRARGRSAARAAGRRLTRAGLLFEDGQKLAGERAMGRPLRNAPAEQRPHRGAVADDRIRVAAGLGEIECPLDGPRRAGSSWMASRAIASIAHASVREVGMTGSRPSARKPAIARSASSGSPSALNRAQRDRGVGGVDRANRLQGSAGSFRLAEAQPQLRLDHRARHAQPRRQLAGRTHRREVSPAR